MQFGYAFGTIGGANLETQIRKLKMINGRLSSEAPINGELQADDIGITVAGWPS